MAMLLIAFAAAWVIRALWDGRRSDYRNPDNRYNQCVLAGSNGTAQPAPQHRSGPDVRYALGWTAFQLRHGWPAMIHDVRSGWDDAQRKYHAWLDGQTDERPRAAEAWRSGWAQARRELPDTRRRQLQDVDAEPPAPTSAFSGAEQGRPHTVPEPPGARVIVSENPHRNGDRMTAPTGEVTGITAYRNHLQQTLDFAARRIETAQSDIANADAEIAAHETSHANLGAAGMGSETTGGVAELIEAAQFRKDAALRNLNAAEKAKANAENLLTDLDRQGHTAVEESVKGASSKVAETSFYEN